MGQLHLVPAERHGVLADVRHAHPGHDRQGQRAVDEASAELGPPGEVVVEVDLVGVAGEQGEPDVVSLGHRAAETAPVDVADVEVLEVAPLPAWNDRHHTAPFVYRLASDGGAPAPRRPAARTATDRLASGGGTSAARTTRREPGAVVGQHLVVADAERLDPALLAQGERDEEAELDQLRIGEMAVEPRP